ncbi:MAG TPA: hypothetical protein VG737_16270 [Cyclobacteriaceae bacterium]|nr:hypothetical protein [Cyclobacteriaceae bacterium]
MNRRTAILYALGGIGSVAAIPLINFFGGKSNYIPDIVKASGEPVVLSLIANEKEILEIGRTIDAQSAETVDGDKLIAMVLEGIPKNCYSPNLNEPEFKLNISRKIQSEFKNKQIRVVNGWVLSKTESIQCHLHHWLSTQR